MAATITEGKIPFIVGDETFETYFKVAGDVQQAEHGPVVVLHGGPGISHDYLLPIADLVSTHGPNAVIFYDQLGSGRSTHLQSKNTSFWTIDLFIDELENLLSHFGIVDNFNLIAHSWGGTLASEFVVRRQPKGLRRLVLMDCLASARLRNEAIGRLRKKLPEEVQATLAKHEKEGTTKCDEYKANMLVFWETFACRVKPFPQEVTYSLGQPEIDPTVLDAMRNGETGLATQWDITDRIHLMRHVTTLIINGEHDYMTDEVCAPFYWGIDKVKWVKFAQSSHMPHWEERERYMQVVGDFLAHP
ncbi:hypothetical protein EYR38_002212 [Pleurotus pulmonarius]|nr:hypothetical protein EYR38_002212 [Pleurotus pulmonarius]